MCHWEIFSDFMKGNFFSLVLTTLCDIKVMKTKWMLFTEELCILLHAFARLQRSLASFEWPINDPSPHLNYCNHSNLNFLRKSQPTFSRSVLWGRILDLLAPVFNQPFILLLSLYNRRKPLVDPLEFGTSLQNPSCNFYSVKGIFVCFSQRRKRKGRTKRKRKERGKKYIYMNMIFKPELCQDKHLKNDN